MGASTESRAALATLPEKHAVTQEMYHAGLKYLRGRGTAWDVTDLYLAMEDARVSSAS